MIKVEISAAKLGASDEILKKLGSNSSRVQADALNRTAVGMRTDGTRLIVKESGLKRPIIFNSFKILKASINSSAPNAAVTISGKSIPSYDFGARPASPMTGKTKGGVRIKVGSNKIQFKHAFVGNMPSGHIGVFQRQKGITNDAGRERIKEMFGPSVPQFAHREEVEQEVSKKAAERFDKRFQQQAARFLNKQGMT